MFPIGPRLSIALLLLLLLAPRDANAEDQPPTITWHTIKDGHENRMEVGVSSVEVVPKNAKMNEMQIRRLAVRSTYTQPVSGTLVVLHPRPGSDVEWPTAFHLYVEASPPDQVAVANYMIAIDVSPLRTLGVPPPPPRDPRVRAYLLDMGVGADARPLAGKQIQQFDPVLDSLDQGLRQFREAQWQLITDSMEADEEKIVRTTLISLAGAYGAHLDDPIARATAIALYEFGGQIGVDGVAYFLARALDTPPAPPATGKRPGLHWVPVPDPAESARLMEKAARVDGEPLAWFHLFKTSPEEKERFVYALLLRTWEQRCPGDRFDGIEEVLQAGNARWTPEEGMKLVVQAIRLGAEAGFAETQLRLAGLYLEGTGGMPADPKAAKDWAYKAAQQGSIEGCVFFANLLLQTLRQDDIELAAQYFKRAAEFGHAHAAYSLASMHLRAMLGLPDHEQTAIYLGIAARLDHPQAVAAIDEMLEKLSEEQRKRVSRKIDEEMKEISKRQQTLAANIQKLRRTGEDRKHLQN